MKVIVDGRDDLIKVAEGTRFGAFVEELKLFLARRDRVVTTFVLDGKELASHERAAVDSRSVDEFTTLDVTSVSPLELSSSVLDQFHGVLAGIDEAYLKAGEALTAGQSDQALTLFHQAFESWNVVITGVRDVVRLHAVPWDQIQVDGKPFSEHLNQLTSALTGFRRAFALRDVVKISDIAEYQLKPLIPQWAKTLNGLKGFISKRSA